MLGQARSAAAYATREFLMRGVGELEWIELTCEDECR